MTGNFYYQNDEEIAVFNGHKDRKTLLTIDVACGEVLDFLANLTTHNKTNKNDMIKLDLVDQDGEVVATSVDDGNGNDDNLSLSLLYQAKMDVDSTFEVVAQAWSKAHRIPEKQLQIGYKTYGKGLELTLL